MRIIIISDSALDAALKSANAAIDSYCRRYSYRNFNQVLSKLTKTGQIPLNYQQLQKLSQARRGSKFAPSTLKKWGIVLVNNDYQISSIQNKITNSRGSRLQVQRGRGAWLVYTELHRKNQILTNENSELTRKSDTDAAVNQEFGDYLSSNGVTVDDLESERKNLYDLQFFMQSKTDDSRIRQCCKSRIRADRGVFIVVDDNGKIGVGNIARCGSKFCPYCYSHDAKNDAEKSLVVQKTHIENGGETLLLTLTAPHSARTVLANFLAKMQSAYEIFNEKSRRLLKKIGCIGRLKSIEYVYSIKNGHAPHIHVAYATGAISDDDLQQLRKKLLKIWIDALVHEKLIKNKNQRAAAQRSALSLAKNSNAFSYAAKISKTQFDVASIEKIKQKISKNRCLTIFELAILAKNGEFDKSKFSRIYSQVIRAFKNVHTLKYSAGFLNELGLMVEVEPPKCAKNQHNNGDETHSATNASNTANRSPNAKKRRKWRYIYEQKRKIVTLQEVDFQIWQLLVKNDEHLIFLGMAQLAYNKNTPPPPS